MIRVLICDDQDVVCEGLSAILGTLSDIEVVGITYDGVEAIEAIPSAKPDVVLMDLKMPGMNGVEACKIMRSEKPALRVVLMTAYAVEDLVQEALKDDAVGIFFKPLDIEKVINLLQGVKEACNGGGLNLFGES